MEDTVIYIERPKSKHIKLKDLKPDFEYYPCEEVDEGGVYIEKYNYYFIKRDRDIYAFVEESVMPKYWNHEYVSPQLHIKAIKTAAKKNRRVTEVLDFTNEPDMIGVVFTVSVLKDCNGEEAVKDVLSIVDSVIEEVRKEAEVIEKRELLKYVNTHKI